MGDRTTQAGTTTAGDEACGWTAVEAAIEAIDQARRDAAGAKAAVRRGRDELVQVLREHLDGVGTAAAYRTSLVGSLYWDHPTVDVSDLTAAMGLSGEEVRRLAGPRTIVEPCRRCGAGAEVVSLGRSRVPSALCTDCRTATVPPVPPEPPTWEPPASFAIGPGW